MFPVLKAFVAPILPDPTSLISFLRIIFVRIKLHYSEYIYISALSIFLGHIFPVWLKFKGGKGVATLLGILFCINYSLALIFIVTWFIIFIISKYSSLSSLIASLGVPIFNFIFISNGDYYFFIILFVLVFYTHRDNIKRLINNTESKTKIY